ncbi:hypothetical protein EBU95_20260 [bacterium]|nr:hypothetical protein [bacterium]
MPFEYHKKLNEKFWKNEKFDKNTRNKLVDIALDFYGNLQTNAPLEDIQITGSITNYNYTKKSDIDLHLRVDYKKVNKDTDLVFMAFDGEAYKWRLKHDIVIQNHPIEIFVEDASIHPHKTKSIYSLLKNEWIKKPVFNPPEVDEQNVDKKYNFFRNEIDFLIKEKDKTSDKIKLKAILKRAKNIKKKLSEARKECMKSEEGFDYCVENLVFKKLRDAGYLEKLNDLKIETFDKIFTEQTWNSGLQTMFMSDIMGKVKKKKDPRHMKPFVRDPGTRKHVQTVPNMHKNLDKFPEVGMLKKTKGRRIISEPRAQQIAAFYNINLSEKPSKLGRSSVSIRKQNNIYVLES